MKAKTKNVIIGAVDGLVSYGFTLLAIYEVCQQNVTMANWKFLLPLACAIVFLYIAIQRIPQWLAMMGFMAIGLSLVCSIGQPDKTPVVIAAIIFICSFITYIRRDDDDEEKSEEKRENNTF